MDGVFTLGPLAGKTVDVRYSARHEALLSTNPDAIPDDYLVVDRAGPDGGGGGDLEGDDPAVRDHPGVPLRGGRRCWNGCANGGSSWESPPA